MSRQLSVIAGDQSGNLDGDNYDRVRPLRMVSELLNSRLTRSTWDE